MEIGTWVKMIREKRGLSQQELAKLSGLSPSFISLIERGERKEITYESVVKLTRALKSNITEFYKSTQTNSFVVADRIPDDIVKELNQSLPISVPLYKDISATSPQGYHCVPRQLLSGIGGLKVELRAVISNKSIDHNLIRDGDILICGKISPIKGDICIYESPTGMMVDFFNKNLAVENCWVLIQSVRRFRQIN